MSETTHPAERLRQAEIALEIADQRTAEPPGKRSPWQQISPRRLTMLSGNLNLLAKASKLCDEAGADPQSPLVSAIRTRHNETKHQLRNLMAVYGVLVIAILALGGTALWSTTGAPVITDPKAGERVDQTISVSGSSPRALVLPGTRLYIFVKPLGYHDPPLSYWLQPMPDVSLTGWQTKDVGIGDEDDGGDDFLICAILSSKALPSGWYGPERPQGKADCIEVIRK